VPQGASRKGRPNRTTANARDAIAAFVDAQAPRLGELLNKIEAKDGPAAAWKCIQDVIEYHVPKLQRTEITGKDGGPVSTEVRMVFEGLKPLQPLDTMTVTPVKALSEPVIDALDATPSEPATVLAPAELEPRK
jgi:hypothetical protein